MTDQEIKDAIQKYFEFILQNFDGDELVEGPLNCNDHLYDQALGLLTGAKIQIIWAGE